MTRLHDGCDAAAGTAPTGALAGRVWLPDGGGSGRGGRARATASTTSRSWRRPCAICARLPDPAAIVRDGKGERIGALARHPRQHARGAARPAASRGCWRPSTCRRSRPPASPFPLLHAGARDRGAGARRAREGRGDPQKRAGPARRRPRQARARQPQAAELKRVLIEQGAWSQYLEVGIGPDAEIFTKAQPMAAVGHGMEAGLHPISTWNNPEPEVVLVVTSQGRDRRRHARQRRQPARRRGPLGAAALQGQGQQRLDRHRPVHPPLRRRVHARHVRRIEVSLKVEGEDGFTLEGRSSMARDRPRPGGPRRADAGAASPVSRRRRAVPRHHVRAGRRIAAPRARASRTRSAT